MSEERFTALTIAIGVLKREGILENAQVLKNLRTELFIRTSGDGGKSESAELDALRRDAERYRFLRDRMGFSQAPGKEATMSMTQYIEAPRHDFHNDWLGERFGASVDQAIDAAIAAKKEKEE